MRVQPERLCGINTNTTLSSCGQSHRISSSPRTKPVLGSSQVENDHNHSAGSTDPNPLPQQHLLLLAAARLRIAPLVPRPAPVLLPSSSGAESTDPCVPSWWCSHGPTLMPGNCVVWMHHSGDHSHCALCLAGQCCWADSGVYLWGGVGRVEPRGSAWPRGTGSCLQ